MTVNDDSDLLKKVIISNELWLYGYDIETKAQSSQWKRLEEPRPKNALHDTLIITILPAGLLT